MNKHAHLQIHHRTGRMASDPGFGETQWIVLDWHIFVVYSGSIG